MLINLTIVCLIDYLILCVLILISVAFVTLIEVNILGYIQIRNGPNNVGIIGILQPIADAVNLFSNEQILPYTSNNFIYSFSPILNLILFILLWVIYPLEPLLISFEYSVLFFVCLTGLSVYPLITIGWSSNSNYALLGGLRAVAQAISYEVSLALIILSLVWLTQSLSVTSIINWQNISWFLFLSLPLSILWLASSLAETNRTPFDFAEGESELVSGFNVEYSSVFVAIIFIAEYLGIILISILLIVFFIGGSLTFLPINIIIIIFLFFWARGTLPRLRYDNLISLSWNNFLPISLNYLLFFIGLSSIFYH